MKKGKIKFYSLVNMDKIQAHYKIIYGERSNGKTFSVQERGLTKYLETGEQMAIIRRYDEDFKGKLGRETFTHFINNPYRGNVVEQLSNGKWNGIYYYSGTWTLSYTDEKGEVTKDVRPFCYAFAISQQEHVKSTSYPNITTILFDEFMTRGLYLTDEFVMFTNLLSTIIRQRNNVVIYMCGNTVNKWNPYFKEMGLKNVLKMKAGDIQQYEFAVYDKEGEEKSEKLRIAVEYSDSPDKKGKDSDVYFAFDNAKLQMITKGVWELAVYPHLPYKYKNRDIIGEYFVEWEGIILHCEIINVEDIMFTYVHQKTTPVKDEEMDLVFTTEFNARYNYRRKITKPVDEVGKKIYWFYQNDKVFYQDNDVGEVMRNYLQWCKSDRGFV